MIRFSFVLFIWFITSNLNAQNTTLYFGDTIFVNPLQEFWVDLQVNDFDNVSTFSFSLEYDSSKLVLVNYELPVLSDMVVNAGPELFNAAWISNTGLGAYLADSSILLRLHFTAKNFNFEMTSINWATQPLPVEFYEFNGGDIIPISAQTIPKIIVIRACNVALDLGIPRTLCAEDTIQIIPSCQNCQYLFWNDAIISGVQPRLISSEGLYFATAIADWHCFACDSILVTEVSPPVSHLPDSVCICAGESAILSPEIVDDAELIWSNGETTPSIQVSAPGIYSVTAINSFGCTTMDSILIGFIECNSETRFFVPNIFIPNERNNENAAFGVFFRDISAVKNYRLTIYDRWGSLVFSSTDPSDVWDGTIDGKPSQAGVYLFGLMIAFQDGAEELLSGSVTLINN